MNINDTAEAETALERIGVERDSSSTATLAVDVILYASGIPFKSISNLVGLAASPFEVIAYAALLKSVEPVRLNAASLNVKTSPVTVLLATLAEF